MKKDFSDPEVKVLDIEENSVILTSGPVPGCGSGANETSYTPL